ncbi:MAG: hypothetical protein SOY49_04580 [Prevotella sp.]|nr:hypothetical protein [Prevotella sp.]
MKRNITQQLQAWKVKTDRKPLIVNCDGNEEVANIFAQDYDD